MKYAVDDFQSLWSFWDLIFLLQIQIQDKSINFTKHGKILEKDLGFRVLYKQ